MTNFNLDNFLGELNEKLVYLFDASHKSVNELRHAERGAQVGSLPCRGVASIMFTGGVQIIIGLSQELQKNDLLRPRR